MKIYLVIVPEYSGADIETKVVKAFKIKEDAEEFISHYKAICPFDSEQEKNFKYFQSNLYILMDNDARFDNMTNDEIDKYRYAYFEKNGFSKDQVDKYDEYIYDKINKCFTPYIDEIELE